jgi:hypothetical protein
MNSMSAYPTATYVNLWCNGIGNESVNNIGFASVQVNNNIIRIDSLFTITPVSDPTCFNEGTKILCLNTQLIEEYIPIEKLRTGDVVKSYKHGYKKIELIGKNVMINNPEKFSSCMYKMEKTENNGLTEDLFITGYHSILVDDLGMYKKTHNRMIEDKYLLLCSDSHDFIQLTNTNLYTYYHFVLENNGNDKEQFGVWANGILTETISRRVFITQNLTLL